MNYILKIFSYIFHPLFMPVLGTVIYFETTPKFVPDSFLYAKLIAITILTVIVPILFYFMLRNLGRIDSIFIDDVQQRRVPLIFQIILTGIVLSIVVNSYEFPELYYFFLGILGSAAIAFISAALKYKMSLHMVGIAGVLFFVIWLSIFYNSNLLTVIALLCFVVGAVASSRLQEKAHSMPELCAGFLAGGLPQLAVLLFFSL
jgi:hypothetical protein